MSELSKPTSALSEDNQSWIRRFTGEVAISVFQLKNTGVEITNMSFKPTTAGPPDVVISFTRGGREYNTTYSMMGHSISTFDAPEALPTATRGPLEKTVDDLIELYCSTPGYGAKPNEEQVDAMLGMGIKGWIDFISQQKQAHTIPGVKDFVNSYNSASTDGYVKYRKYDSALKNAIEKKRLDC